MKQIIYLFLPFFNDLFLYNFLFTDLLAWYAKDAALIRLLLLLFDLGM